MGDCIWKLSYGLALGRYLIAMILTPRTGSDRDLLGHWLGKRAPVNHINFNICSQFIHAECCGSMCQIKRNRHSEQWWFTLLLPPYKTATEA